jgi:hypothetical protein
MSPPQVWGPATWSFFHTLAHKVNDNQPPIVYQQIFLQIRRICGFLPCPECSRDASSFLGKIHPNEIQTKRILIDKLYVFHNYVNKKKKKPLFDYGNINKYKDVNIIQAYNTFLKNYNTRGNMKLLTETFQRNLIINELKKWFLANISRFTGAPPLSPPSRLLENPLLEKEEQKPKLEENNVTAVDLAPPLSKVDGLVDSA